MVSSPLVENCTFCKMIRGVIKSYTVFEDEVSLAFLDHRPLFPGHMIVVPKIHYETMLDLPPSLITALFTNVQLLARALEQGLNSDGSFIAVNNRVSQSVPHFHIHTVPRRKKDGLKGFFWPRNPYKDEESILKVQSTLKRVIASFQSAGK